MFVDCVSLRVGSKKSLETECLEQPFLDLLNFLLICKELENKMRWRLELVRGKNADNHPALKIKPTQRNVCVICT